MADLDARALQELVRLVRQVTVVEIYKCLAANGQTATGDRKDQFAVVIVGSFPSFLCFDFRGQLRAHHLAQFCALHRNHLPKIQGRAHDLHFGVTPPMVVQFLFF